MTDMGIEKACQLSCGADPAWLPLSLLVLLMELLTSPQTPSPIICSDAEPAATCMKKPISPSGASLGIPSQPDLDVCP